MQTVKRLLEIEISYKHTMQDVTHVRGKEREILILFISFTVEASMLFGVIIFNTIINELLV